MTPENLSDLSDRTKKRLPEGSLFKGMDQLSSVIPSMRRPKDGAEMYSDS